MSSRRKSVLGVVLAALLVLAMPMPANAFDGRTGDTVTVAKGETVEDDLYVGADSFVLDGTVNGDVVAAGKTLTVNGTINGNLVAAGKTIVVNGAVTGDVVAAGSVLLFGESASIGGDVVSAGYSLEFKDGANVGRDAVLGAAQIVLAGDVERNVMAGTAALKLAGSIGGDVNAAVGEAGRAQVGPPPTDFVAKSPVDVPVIPQGLTIDPSARIAGNLQYTQNSELSFPAGIVGGQITRLKQPEDGIESMREPTTAERIGTWATSAIRSMVTLILLGLLLLWLLPGFAKALSQQLETKPWPSLGWGVFSYAAFFFLLLLMAFAATLGAVVFGLLTLSGLSAAIAWSGVAVLFVLILGFVLATAFLAKIIVGMTLGRWILTKANTPLAEDRYWPMVIGVGITVVVIALLSFPLIPGVLGGLLDFAAVLFGLGALALWLRPRLSRQTVAP